MNTPLLTFNAKSVSCEKLETTLTARKAITDRTFGNLKRNITLNSNYQSLLVAPRGSGKSHITKVMYCRITKDKELRDKVMVAYMIEDESGIASFMHLLLHILDALHRYNEPGAENVPEIKNEISEIQSKGQESAFEHALLTILGDRKLVLLIENFNTVISQMGDKGAGLRDFMHNHDKISILATTQSLSDELNNSDYPFYQFFDTQHLSKISFEEMLELVRALISIEEDEKIKEKLNNALDDPNQDFKAKLRAIYDLTMGNHRLIVDFYNFLKADLKSDLSTVFIRQMNNLKSYYEQFIKQLSTQQQRIVQVLSQNRKPITPKDISQKAFLKPNSVSKQLNELEKLGYVDVHKIGRNSLYELNEPLMRISYEINENPDGIASLFVNFLKSVYDRKYLIKNYLKYKHGQHLAPELKERYVREMLMHQKALGEGLHLEAFLVDQFTEVNSMEDLEIKIDNFAELEDTYHEVITHFNDSEFQEGLDILENCNENIKGSPVYYFIYGLGKANLEEYDIAIEYYKEAIRIKSDYPMAFNNLGNAYYSTNKFEDAIKCYENSLTLNPKNPLTYKNLGTAYFQLNQFKLANEKYIKSIKYNSEDHFAYYYLGVSQYNTNEFESAIKNLKYAIKLRPKFTFAKIRLGETYFKIGKFKKAIEFSEIAITEGYQEEKTYLIMALSNASLGKFKSAITNLENASSINPDNIFTKLKLMISFLLEKDIKSAYIQWQNIKTNVHHNDNITMYISQFFTIWFSSPNYEIDHSFIIFNEMLYSTQSNIDTEIANGMLGAFDVFKFIDKNKLTEYKSFHQKYMDRFGKDERLTLTNKYFDIGMRYLVYEEERAIYDFTKEERAVFLDVINDK